jgi:hypothetical protein
MIRKHSKNLILRKGSSTTRKNGVKKFIVQQGKQYSQHIIVGGASRSDFRRIRRESVFKSNSSQRGHITQNFDLLWPIFSKAIPSLTEDALKVNITEVLACHNGFIKSLGIKFGTKHYKAITLYAKLLIEGRQAEPVSRVSVGKKDKWPNCFGSLRPIYRSIINDDTPKPLKVANLQLLNTLFNLNKVCGGLSELNIDDIVAEFKIPNDMLQAFERWLVKRLGTQDTTGNLQKLRVENLIFGPANGPNKQPKVQSAPDEAYSLLDDPKLGPHFKKMCELTGNQGFLSFVAKQAKKSKDNTFLRKLVSIPDKGNKSRIVAICDFWTQSLLDPLEKAEINELMTKFGDKSAFLSHDSGFDKVKQNLTNDWVSIDATSWTDNFPLVFQYTYLKLRYGLLFAKSWAQLVGKCDWHLGDSDKTIKYGKGQGMGTKGSFIIASITDHYVIEWWMEQHYGKVNPYCKVGDDLVASDKDNILIKNYPTIGVPVNIFKSKMETPKGHFLEFVSRNLWDRADYSAISANLVYKARKQPYLLPVLYEHLRGRMSLSPSYNELIDSMSIEGRTKDNIYKIIDIIQRLSGMFFNINIPEDKQVTNQLYNRIIGRMLAKTVTDIVKLINRAEFSRKGKIFDEYIIAYLNISYSDRNEPWSTYMNNKMSLNQIKILQYVKQYWNLKSMVSLGKLPNPNHNIATLSPSSGVRGEMEQSILSNSIRLQAELNNIKIVNDLHVELKNNNDIIVDLFKTINKHLKAEQAGLKLPDLAPHRDFLTENLWKFYEDIRNDTE